MPSVSPSDVWHQNAPIFFYNRPLDAVLLSASTGSWHSRRLRGGCSLGTQITVEVLPQDHVLVKLEFTNAFNRLHRRDVLLSVHTRIPELYTFCLSAYSHPSILFFGPEIVSSEEGPQQGDPIGPLLFCNTIHPLLSSLQAHLTRLLGRRHTGRSSQDGSIRCCRNHQSKARNWVCHLTSLSVSSPSEDR